MKPTDIKKGYSAHTHKISHLLKRNRISLELINIYLRLLFEHSDNKYVFVATTGRSGSNTLANLMRCVPNAICRHEPYPVMFNPDHESLQGRDYFRRRFLLKSIYIRRLLRRKHCYIETNHQFIKNFSELAVDEFSHKIRVIHLVRDPISVALSFYRKDSIPGITDKGKKFLLDPCDKDNIINLCALFNGPKLGHYFYRCLWYWYEVEARVRQFKEKNPAVKIYTIKTNELNDVHAIELMMKELSIEYDESILKKNIGRRDNQKAHKTFNVLDLSVANKMNENIKVYIKDQYGNVM